MFGKGLDNERECSMGYIVSRIYRMDLYLMREALYPIGHERSTVLKPGHIREDTMIFYADSVCHSGKVTCATQLHERGTFDEQTIMSRTGHRSTAVRTYKRASSTLAKAVEIGHWAATK